MYCCCCCSPVVPDVQCSDLVGVHPADCTGHHVVGAMGAGLCRIPRTIVSREWAGGGGRGGGGMGVGVG